MTHVQTRHIEGTFTAAGADAKRAVAIPLLPAEGAWSITGHLIAVDQATPRHAVTFFPKFTGVCEGGVATPNHGNKLVTQPLDGGSAQTWAPGGIGLKVSGQQLEIEITGIKDKSVVWAYSLDVVVISLPGPGQAPSDKRSPTQSS
jgi:hypothetical protein